MDTDQLIQRDTQILRQAQGLGANPSFILVFGMAGLMAVIGALCIAALGLWGVAVLVVLAAGAAVSMFTSIGDKAMLITLILVALLDGVATLGVAGTVWLQSSTQTTTTTVTTTGHH